MKPTMLLKWSLTAGIVLVGAAGGVLVVLMTPSEWLPTVQEVLATVAFVIFVLLWPKLRRTFIRRKVRRVRGARRLSKVYRRSRRHGTQSSFSASAR